MRYNKALSFPPAMGSSKLDLPTYYQGLHFGFSFSITLDVKLPGNLFKFSKYKKVNNFRGVPYNLFAP